MDTKFKVGEYWWSRDRKVLALIIHIEKSFYLGPRVSFKKVNNSKTHTIFYCNLDGVVLKGRPEWDIFEKKESSKEILKAILQG